VATARSLAASQGLEDDDVNASPQLRSSTAELASLDPEQVTQLAASLRGQRLPVHEHKR
jgi:hypothetical protein